MPYLTPILCVLGAVFLFLLSVTLVCFFKIFFSYRGKKEEDYPIPEGEIYEEHRDNMIKWIDEANAKCPREVEIVSRDGLTLRGKYYEKKKGLPIEILFHGYRGSGKRDLSGGVHRCFVLDHNALVVDHRASGRSDGHVITFGAKERFDCLDWVDFAIKNIDANAKIIITGISMGAATVMTASGDELPENVIGVLADCGYTSTREIVCKVIKDLKLPPKLLYPFARLGAIVFGGFDPDSSSPIESMSRCTLPIIFFHGDADAFVPLYMSEENYNACASKVKRLVVTKGAGHGLCFPVNQEQYLTELDSFFKPYL